MTILKNTFEGGTNGSNLTVAGSGGTSGDAFNVLLINNASTPSGNSSVTYATGSAVQGSLGLHMILGATGPTYVRWNDAQGGTRFVIRRSLKFATLPTSGQTATLGTMHNGSSVVADIRLDSAGKIVCFVGATFITAANTASPTLSTGTQYWLEYATTLESGGGGNGNIEYKVTDNAGSTVGSIYTGAGTFSTGTTAVSQYRIGGAVTGSGWTVDDLDSIQAGPLSGAGNWIGPLANIPPTTSGAVSGGNVQSPSTTVTINYTDADSDGTIVTTTTQMTYPESSPPSITGGTGTSPTFPTTSATSALYAQTHTVTDNGSSSTTSAPVEVYVEGTGTIVPLAGTTSTVVTGGSAWTLIGGGTTEGGNLNDGSGTTMVESPDITSTEVERRYRMGPFTARTTPRITLLGAILTQSGSNINKVRVYADTTQITERLTSTLKKVTDGSPSDVTTTAQDLYFDLTSGEVAAIAAVTNGRDKLWVALAVDLS